MTALRSSLLNSDRGLYGILPGGNAVVASGGKCFGRGWSDVAGDGDGAVVFAPGVGREGPVGGADVGGGTGREELAWKDDDEGVDAGRDGNGKIVTEGTSVGCEPDLGDGAAITIISSPISSNDFRGMGVGGDTGN